MPKIIFTHTHTHTHNAKKRKKKEEKVFKGQMLKPSYPTREINTLIEDEGPKGKKKNEQKDREWGSNPVTLDNLVASYDPHGSYCCWEIALY